MGRRLFYCDNHDMGLPPEHRFPTPKYRKVRELLAADGVYDFEPAPFARRELIERVHDSAYVDGFFSGTLDPQIMRRIGFPWSEGLVRRTLASVGGTLCATQDALDFGFGGNLAGGTHHAFRSEGSGFCVFNDIAIAALWLRHERDIPRVAVVDCDVHQGDGTAQIFENDPQVFTLSLHGRKNFPFRKQRSSLDIELEDGTTDDIYIPRLRSALDQVFAFQPQVIFYQSGVDALAADTLGRLALTHEGLMQRDAMVFSEALARRIPVVITLGGGYGKPIEQTALAHANTYRTALDIFGRPPLKVKDLTTL
jgi:acetoin utilization deacetylase AcuC-like enzyme